MERASCRIIATERITPSSTSNGNGGVVDWIIKEDGSFPVQAGGNGSPLLGVGGSPELPTDPPEGLPSNLPMSNWGLAHALRLAGKAGVPRPVIIHFNNCFNMSMELLHSIRNLAGFATGYANYNFFTAGEAYPLVFRTLRQAGSATAEQLARWLAAGNHTVLFNKQNHPTVGATIELRRIDKVKLLLDSLANQLSSQIAAIPPASRRAHPNWIRIQNAVLAAQHYDTQAGYELKSPDQLTDLGSFAAQLQQQFQAPHPVNKAAGLLLDALLNVWQYGDRDRPHVDENQMWDFLDRRLGINILLPDPAVEGIWDWRSPYYFAGKVDPTKPPPLANQIEFLTDGPGNARPAWVRFLELYHDVRPLPVKKLTRLLPPSFPRFERNFKPKYPPTCTPRDKVGALLPERPPGQHGGPGHPWLWQAPWRRADAPPGQGADPEGQTCQVKRPTATRGPSGPLFRFGSAADPKLPNRLRIV